MEDFGKRLKAERERLALFRQRLRRLVASGRRPSTTYERGEREPNWSYMTMAEGLGVDVMYVFTGTRKGEDGVYAKAYKQTLLSIEMLLGLEEGRLEQLARTVIENEAALGRRESVDTQPYNQAVLDC